MQSTATWATVDGFIEQALGLIDPALAERSELAGLPAHQVSAPGHAPPPPRSHLSGASDP